jgi:putative hydrolase of the HAD superfamily
MPGAAAAPAEAAAADAPPPAAAQTTTSQPRPRFTHVLLDLDDTLYREERVGQTVREHIIDYVATLLSLPRDEAARVTTDLYHAHGTTMAGLVHVGHSIEPDHWHGSVHAPLDYEELLSRDDNLVELLRRMDGGGSGCLKKVVFTNADKRHMRACLRLLGLTPETGSGFSWDGEGYYFENVQALGAERGLLPDTGQPAGGKGFLAKPSHDVFRMVAEHCGAPSPSTCVFVDDSVRNVQGAKAVGMYTVLVGVRDRGERVEGADACVRTVLELPEVLPELFSPRAAPPVVAPAVAFEEEAEKEEVAAAGVPIRVAAG